MTYLYAAYKRHFRQTQRHRLKERGWKKTFHVNRNKKKTGVVKHNL